MLASRIPRDGSLPFVLRPAASLLAVALAAGSLIGTAPAQAASGPSASSPGAASSSSDPQSTTGRLNPTEAASAQAKATGKPVTIDQFTDTGTVVVANPDGTFTRSDSSMPQRVQEAGKWVPVNTTLVRKADGTWTPQAAVTAVAFSGGGSAVVMVSGGGRRVGASRRDPREGGASALQ
ncbi:hypothetical protein [Streptomyces sp. NPDC127190]|uniref:hypothetical protein n=1 Tax=unclassified Streptomyces TaxID=2593676 RepID=UPI0036362F70